MYNNNIVKLFKSFKIKMLYTCFFKPMIVTFNCFSFMISISFFLHKTNILVYFVHFYFLSGILHKTGTDDKLISTPSLIVPANSCSLTISSNSKEFIVVKIIINQTKFIGFSKTEKENYTNKKWISLKNINLGDHKNNLKVQITYKDYHTAKDTIDYHTDEDLNVVFHKCTRLVPIVGYYSDDVTTTGHVSLMKHDKCDFEFRGEKEGVNCNWWEVVPIGGKPVILHLHGVQKANRECAVWHGVHEKENERSKYFVSLVGDPDSDENFTTAYMASPTFRVDDFARVTFSMHYAIHCLGSSLEGYLVPAKDDVFESLSGVDSFVEKTNESFVWKYMKTTVDVSGFTGKYRVSQLFVCKLIKHYLHLFIFGVKHTNNNSLFLVNLFC